MTAVVHARELSRWYGIVMGLNNVSFDIEAGLTGIEKHTQLTVGRRHFLGARLARSGWVC